MLDNSKDSVLAAPNSTISSNSNKDSSFRWYNPFASSKIKRQLSAPEEFDTAEYQGVQNLRNFWNTRLGSTKDVQQKAATLNGNSYPKKANTATLSSSKSINCLLTNNNNHVGRSLSQQDRSLSFRDCRQSQSVTTCDKTQSSTFTAVTRQHHKINGNFPLTAAAEQGGKIHWAKRDDIVYRKKKMALNSNEAIHDGESSRADLENNNTAELATLPSATPVEEITSADKASDESCPNTNSLPPNVNSILSTESPLRRKTSNATRRYSFKTHTKNYYNRKMTSNMNTGSKVATLTQKFNEIIQKDSVLLSEVRRNNGVLISHAGHVYKIKEDKQGKGASRGAQSSTVAESTIVKDAIKKFEKPSAKPKVPTKSQHVLQKTKELVNRKKLKGTTALDLKLDLKSSVLENIKEEAKTPVEQVDESSETKMAPNEDCAAEKQTNKKSRYAKIYDKIRYRSPFASKKKLTKNDDVSAEDEDNESVRKIREAIDSVNKRIENLSKSAEDKIEEMVTFAPAPTPTPEDEYGQSLPVATSSVLPNESFLFRSNTIKSIVYVNPSKVPLESQPAEMVEAVNTELVNNSPSQSEESSSRTTEQYQDDDEELYEPILVKQSTTAEKTEGIASKPLPPPIPQFHLENVCDTVTQTKAMADDDYEPCENYESLDDVSESTCPAGGGGHLEAEDGYEICDPPEPPPPRKPDPPDIRNTTDELPAIPLPKRVLRAAIPPGRSKLPDIPVQTELADDYDDENIYDTIKGADLYEMVQSKSLDDTISMASNCYESINSYKRTSEVLRKAGSSSTISSDQKTNSLYGMSMEGGAGGCMLAHRNSQSTNEASSDNSDDWVDISDQEDGGHELEAKHQFIVVRERAKCHRSPDWSKRVRRDKRLHHQNKTDVDDDSDHYYEPLFPSGTQNFTSSSKIHSWHSQTTSGNNSTGNITLESSCGNTTKQDTRPSNDSISQFHSDDYDSFDTDYESENNGNKKDDSGVDISNARLPDPPASTNQVYAALKKFRNFMTISKKSCKSSKSLDGIGKTYENTQFYVDTEEYNTTEANNLVAKKPTKFANKSDSKSSTEDPYENTEFHAQISPVVDQMNQTPVGVTENNITENNNQPIMTRKKSKSGKSFRSKIRKSLTSNPLESNINNESSLNGKNSTFYVSDAGELDSGIFEKTQTSEVSTVTRKPKIATNISDVKRRKTIIGIRPNDPPPPPPPSTGKECNKANKTRATASWYAECGVFKSNNICEDRVERSSNTSWYAEAGLYQTSGASVASSSGSSGVSTGGEGCPGDDNSHSMFLNEPLYQIYNAAKLESISIDMDDQDSTDGYEEIGCPKSEKQTRPSALQLVGPKQGPSRTLWSEIPEVIGSHILSTLTPTERRLQEAKFEILTSEASYLKSLNLLRAHFINHPAFRDATIISAADRKTLFSHIYPVHECSDILLSDMENCWQDNIMLMDLSKNIYKNAEKYFHVYIQFCEHQGKMDRTLRKLKEPKNVFGQTLAMLEIDPICCGLTLHSFLMLPMQRITRLPLLIDSVFSKLNPDDDEFEGWKMTLAILNKIVAQCNDAANRSEQIYEIEKLARQIEFPSHIRSLAIASVGVPAAGSKTRFLVRRGQLTHLVWRGDDTKLTFGKKFTKYSLYAFLFTDLLVLTKRKGDSQYVVFDYCPRNLLTVTSGEVLPQLPTKELHQTAKNLILLTLLENHEKKTIEMVLSCPSVSEQQRWLQVTSSPEAETPGEKLYEQWDCPQVITKNEFVATEPDLLSLEPGDVVNVTRKLPDGWFQGERIRDGSAGWFPGSFTEEVNSAHVRARNLKQRYRLLTFTASYLESQKRK